ncbi:hypothetical protein COO91_06584 [Nostoc flagelliforme CCNUN1]|uniref:Uncharacterized protein n=1 Tax=Nostoc flagelliforme CCNUN1 TaxID=2038116 RepID=A0A2K8SYP2_9NOSO|nr:hypothetical protein COO91_06584 [Nostoc flagelliforme CCNUN1]
MKESRTQRKHTFLRSGFSQNYKQKLDNLSIITASFVQIESRLSEEI